MTMEIDPAALLLALGFCGLLALFWQKTKNHPPPAIPFSNFHPLEHFNRGIKAKLAKLPRFLRYGAFFLFLLAFTDPHFFFPRHSENHPNAPQQISEGIAIYFILDESGSMADKVDVTLPDGTSEQIPKIELLKKLTTHFILGDPQWGMKGRPNDLIGLMAFARGAQVLSPLTLDHASLLPILSKIHIVQANQQEGTAIGYAIFKTANLITATRNFAQESAKQGVKPPYEIKSAIMILVTDGFQDPNPLDAGKRLRNLSIPEAAEYAKTQDIRLYAINIDPEFAEKEEYEPHRNQFQRAAESTGGRLYLVTRSQTFADIYKQIDQLEKSRFTPPASLLSKDQLPQLYARVSWYPYLILLGLLLLFSALFLRTTYLRSGP
jgi:Ca-activated chloride channel homolog